MSHLAAISAFALLFAAISLQLLPVGRLGARLPLVLGAAACLLGLGTLLAPKALLALALAATLLHLQRNSKALWLNRLGVWGIALWALAAGFHLWPGFSPLRWSEHFGRLSLPLVWHFDKGLGGLLLLVSLGATQAKEPCWPGWPRAAKILAGAVAICLLAWAVGLASPDPRWMPLAGLWLAGNLFLAVVAEEAFFRGLLQGQIGAALAPRLRYGVLLAQLIVAVLFALLILILGVTSGPIFNMIEKSLG